MNNYNGMAEKEIVENLFDLFFTSAAQGEYTLGVCISFSMWLVDRYKEIVAREDNSK